MSSPQGKLLKQDAPTAENGSELQFLSYISIQAHDA